MFSRESKVGIDSIIYIAGGFLSSSISALILIPILVANLSTDEYGIISLVAVSASGVSIIMTLGTHGSITQNYHSQDPHFGENSVLIGTILSFIGTMAMVLLLILCLSSFIFELNPFGGKDISFFALVVIGIATSEALILTCSTIFKIQAKPIHFLSVGLARVILTLSFVFYLDMVEALNDVSKILADLSALLIIGSSLVWALRSEFLFGLNLETLRKSLIFGLPLIPHLLAVFLLNVGDRYIIELLLGTEEVGIYSLGYQLSLAIAIVSIGIDQAWTPYFYESVNNPNNEYPKLSYIFHFYSAWVSLFALLFIFSIGSIFNLLGIEGDYRDSIEIIPIIVVGLILQGIYFISSKPILHERKTFLLSSITVSCAFSNILLNIILIPYFGLTGAAIATFLSYFIQVILTMFFSQKFINIPISLVKTFVPVVIVSLISLIILINLRTNSMMFIIAALTATLLVYCVLSIREIRPVLNTTILPPLDQ